MHELRAGFARRDITPALGMPTSLGVQCLVTEIWDPLYVTVLVLDDGQTQAVLIGADLCAFLQQPDMAMRTAVAQALAISPDHVVLNASHSHSAPYLATAYADLLQPYELQVVDADYVQYVQQQMVAAAREARTNAAPVQLWAGQGEVARVAGNRRQRLPDGAMISRHGRPPQEWRDLPEGLIDPDVGVVTFVDRQGHTSGFIANYACHPTAAGGDLHGWVSADFVGYGLRALEAKLNGAPGLFLQGAAGNVGTGKWVNSTPRGDAAAMGQQFAAGMTQALSTLTPVQRNQLRVQRRQVPLHLEPMPPVAVLEERLHKAAATGDTGQVVAAGDALVIARRFREFQQAPISAITVGDLAIACLPAELFVEFGLHLKTASPFRHTLVAAYNDDSLQYIPTQAAFAEGAYEVTGGWRYTVAGDGETLTQGALALLQQLAAHE